MSSYVIYSITNGTTGKVYIGLTKNSVRLRFQQHVSKATRSSTNSHFFNAIRKYGRYDWTERILESGIPTLEQACEKEVYYISSLDTFRNGYNSTIGGEGVSGVRGKDHHYFGVPKSKESIAKAVQGRAATRSSYTKEQTEAFSAACTRAQRVHYGSKQHTVYNNEVGKATGFVGDLAREYKLHPDCLNRVVRGELRYVKGWFLWVGVDGDCSVGVEHTFHHEQYGEVCGTLAYMASEYGVPKGNLCSVTKGVRKSAGGWYVKTAKAVLEESKAKGIDSDTDLKDLDFLKKSSGEESNERMREKMLDSKLAGNKGG